MKKRKIKALGIALAGVLLATTMFASCKQGEPGTVASETSQTPTENVVIEAKELPKLSVYIDENAEGFGTIQEMLDDFKHETKCTGTMDLDIPEGYTCEYTDETQESVHDVELDYIRGRGNSTWTVADKKPFKIKFTEKKSFFGMEENKEWALLANRYDTVMLRNICAFKLGEAMGLKYTPQCVPVEFYMNDEYQGLYFLSETIDVKEGRVGIDELDPSVTSEPDITGGYLFSVICEDYLSVELDAKYNTIETDGGVLFYMNTPSFNPEDGDVCPEQKEYLRKYLQETEDAIMSDSDKIGDYLDLQSAADYWLLQEFTVNEDGFITTSSYLHKERDGKLYFGPVWDFDSAWDYIFYDPRPVEGFNKNPMPWLDHMRANNPEFQALLKERYEVLDAALEDLVKDGGTIDRFAGENRDAWEKDHEKWGYFDAAASVPMEAGDPNANMTYDEAVGAFKKWINDRRDWIKANYDEITDVYATVTFETEDGKEYDVYPEVFRGSFVENPPLIGPEKEGFIFSDWINKETGESVYATEITGPVTFVPEYVSEDETEKAVDIRFALRSISMPVGTENYVPQYNTLPFDFLDTRMTWESSDEKIATVDERGRITALKEGDVVIKATLLSGGTDELKVHVFNPEDTDYDTELKIETVEKLKVKEGDTIYLDVSLTECNSRPENCLLSFGSSEEGVAEIDNGGKLTAVAPGTTVITIRCIRKGIRLSAAKVEVTVE